MWSPSTTFLAEASMSANAMSAVQSLWTCGVLPTAIPRSLAAATSRWFVPTPTLLITRRLGNKSINLPSTCLSTPVQIKPWTRVLSVRSSSSNGLRISSNARGATESWQERHRGLEKRLGRSAETSGISSSLILKLLLLVAVVFCLQTNLVTRQGTQKMKESGHEICEESPTPPLMDVFLTRCRAGSISAALSGPGFVPPRTDLGKERRLTFPSQRLVTEPRSSHTPPCQGTGQAESWHGYSFYQLSSLYLAFC